MDGCMEEVMDGWMDGWMHACMRGWMCGWVEGWMDGYDYRLDDWLCWHFFTITVDYNSCTTSA
jgi:hypothetical protein